MPICDEFSTYLYTIPLKTKSNSDIIIAFTMVAYFKKHGFEIHKLHSKLMSATTFINQQGTKYNTIAPYQHEQKLERYVQTINSGFRSVLSRFTIQTPK